MKATKKPVKKIVGTVREDAGEGFLRTKKRLGNARAAQTLHIQGMLRRIGL